MYIKERVDLEGFVHEIKDKRNLDVIQVFLKWLFLPPI